MALILGAGCSVEAPTSIPVARQIAQELHTKLLADGVLEEGDCPDSNDLSSVADAVHRRTNSQRAVVQRLLDYRLKAATANEGYMIAAAMLREGAISSVITFNFDTALTNAIANLGTGSRVEIVECPDHLARGGSTCVYYLHRNANETDSEAWVLRTEALESEWQNHWQEIIATRVLVAPVVVFAGIGTAIGVLLETVRRIRAALPATTKLFQVGPGTRTNSTFFGQLGLQESRYIRSGWCDFMNELSERLVQEHLEELRAAIDRLTAEQELTEEDAADVIAGFHSLGLVGVGKLRAAWLQAEEPYCPSESNRAGLVADLAHAIAMISRISAVSPRIRDDGVVEFVRDDRVVAAYCVASGCGYRGTATVESRLKPSVRKGRGRVPPGGALIAGTTDAPTISLPEDVIGDEEPGCVVSSPAEFPLIHIETLRANADRVSELVP